MKCHLLVIASFLLLFACQQEKQAASQAPPAATQAPVAAPAPALPSLPVATIEKLFNECDHIDYVFYELPISMSLDEKPSIQNALRFISDTPASRRPDCKGIGRILYHVKGDIALEGEIFFSGNCTYFIFLEKGKPTYGNLMTEDGVKNFQGIIERGMNLSKQKGG
ncbi:MAG: hypothetical protein AAB316_05140 [Bacteroidota bacterium]